MQLARHAALVRASTLCVAFAVLLPGLAPGSAVARCARLEVPAECATSLYVFEGTLESVADHDLTFRVTAAWQGAPPARVTVATSGRRPLAAASDVGTTYLVFARGSDAAHLSVSRCGSSAPLASAGATLAALTALGRTRVPSAP